MYVCRFVFVSSNIASSFLFTSRGTLVHMFSQ